MQLVKDRLHTAPIYIAVSVSSIALPVGPRAGSKGVPPGKLVYFQCPSSREADGGRWGSLPQIVAHLDGTWGTLGGGFWQQKTAVRSKSLRI